MRGIDWAGLLKSATRRLCERLLGKVGSRLLIVLSLKLASAKRVLVVEASCLVRTTVLSMIMGDLSCLGLDLQAQLS